MTKLRCYTLFDITKSNVTNKKSVLFGSDEENLYWQNRRNTQCNLDTIVQVISLRAQPEDITEPVKQDLSTTEHEFGFFYNNEENLSYWSFEFSVNYKGVFSDGEEDLGALYSDCQSVPMIKSINDIKQLPSFLDVSPELRNIYFRVITNE